MIPQRPAVPSSRNFCGWRAVLSFLPRLPWARLPRPAPRLCSRGAASGGPLAAATQESQQLARRSEPAVTPSHPRRPPPPPCWPCHPLSRSFVVAALGEAGWQSRDPGQTRVGRREGRESEVRVACSRRGTAGGPPASGRAPVFQRPGAPTRRAAAAGGRRAQLAAFRAAAGVCACARRGDGARAGRAAKATRRRGGGGGSGPDGDSGRCCCRRTGGDSRRD